MRACIIEIKDLFELAEQTSSNVQLFDRNKRRLVIPLYQREFVWTNEKIEVLLSDIAQRDKFLGNLILDEKESCYEIVDGQQRITTCFLTLVSLYNYYAGQTMTQKQLGKLLKPVNGFCLENESLGTYLSEDNNMVNLHINPDSDVYFQKETFEQAMQTISAFVKKFTAQTDVRDFKDKLFRSKVLVLINDNDPTIRSIEQVFLDINEKAALLEPEDIFKGYCFKNTEVDFHGELRKKWEKLRKCGANFEEYGFEDLSEYLYVFLLVTKSEADTKSKTINQKLYLNGKHILDGMTVDETFGMIDDMVAFGTSVKSFYDELFTTTYRFEDVCPNGVSHGNTNDHLALKSMCRQQLECKKSAYQKIPLMCFINALANDGDIRSSVSYDKFRRIISSLYIYTVLFVHSGERKSKNSLDTTMYNAMMTKPFNESNAYNAAKNLRLSKMAGYAISDSINNFESLANLYSIMDQYDSNDGWVKYIYSDENDHNLEHFVAPDNGVCIEWCDPSQYKKPKRIKLDKEATKRMKKLTINYLIINKKLNESMRSYDIVTKIGMIREWFKNRSADLPKHVEAIITHIEDMASYKALVKLKGVATSEEKIKEDYCKFMEEYTSDPSATNLLNTLSAAFRNAFTN